MKKFLILLAVVFPLPLLLHANTDKPWDGGYAAYKGYYFVYSNELGEQQPPTRQDRKIAFLIEGKIAKEMFESIGPDLKSACGASARLRIREKGDLECTLDKDTPSSPYTCRFGLNLKTGKSIPGSTC
ncbi:hypothetical protein [Massilia sp. YIM B04103]|uniref:hypothetical protein n=1 Tax=Massilia sp. YIM B04103 TaxID=2963106 RepID=UPI00210A9345|nr:hypothetical protein [Massilia sp. YIM B04103]